MDNTTYIKWNDEEWQSIAKRAKALKETRSDLSWMQIAVICQDDIAPERRRSSFNKLSAMKPMFDLLGLDDEGNIPPPPPPPVLSLLPEPEPAPVSALPGATAALAHVPIDLLVTEVLNRGASLKVMAEGVVTAKAAVEAALADHNQRMETLTKRLDEMEKLVLENDEKFAAAMTECARISLEYKEIAKVDKIIRDALLNCAPDVLEQIAQRTAIDGVAMIEDEYRRGTLTPVHPAPVKPTAALRFLLIGPLVKDMERIKQRLPRTLHVDLIHGDNNESAKLPVNIHYCLISGHNDFTRRWQTCRDTYGQSRVQRMENGSIGTFANQIEILASLHQKHHPNGTYTQVT